MDTEAAIVVPDDFSARVAQLVQDEGMSTDRPALNEAALEELSEERPDLHLPEHLQKAITDAVLRAEILSVEPMINNEILRSTVPTDSFTDVETTVVPTPLAAH